MEKGDFDSKSYLKRKHKVMAAEWLLQFTWEVYCGIEKEDYLSHGLIYNNAPYLLLTSVDWHAAYKRK